MSVSTALSATVNTALNILGTQRVFSDRGGYSVYSVDNSRIRLAVQAPGGWFIVSQKQETTTYWEHDCKSLNHEFKWIIYGDMIYFKTQVCQWVGLQARDHVFHVEENVMVAIVWIGHVVAVTYSDYLLGFTLYTGVNRGGGTSQRGPTGGRK